MSAAAPATRIEPTFHEKVWGRPRAGIRLGEIWFRAEPLLLKFIFTSEKLSVQVHPRDEYARARENSAGKTECWYILDAEPGARLAVGFRRPMTRDEIVQSVNAQTIERELNWLEMRRGDFVFVPAGTVHAIGPGLTLCEIQQFSDVTYRLYDYGRPRELHLEKALDVIHPHPAAGRIPPAPAHAPRGLTREFLAGCRYFAVERFAGASEHRDEVDPSRFEVLAFLKGKGEIACGGQAYRYAAEQMWRLAESSGAYRVVPHSESEWLKIYAPARTDDVRAAMRRAGVSEADQNRTLVEEI